MKKDLALLLSDTHLMERTSLLNISIWEQAIEECQRRDIVNIYHLGDVFESRSSQTQILLVTFHRILEMLSLANIKLTIIPGNHDKTDYKIEDSFLTIFKYHPNILLIEDWGIINCLREHLSEEDKLLSISFIPFFDEKSGLYSEYVSKCSSQLDSSVKNILLTHIGIDDAVMNNGTTIENHINKDIFSSWDKVYVGHFHDYQELQDGKIIYIGSAYQGNFGEDNKKGFQILKSDGSLEFVKSKFPEYKKIVVDIEKTTKEDMLKLKSEYGGSEDNIRFIFRGSEEKLVKIEKSEFSTLGIDIKMEKEVIKVVDYSKEQVTTFDTKLIKEEWNKFTEDDKESQDTGNTYLEESLK